jgi:hypothetical protein
VLAPFGAAAAMVPLRSHSPNATVALILALVVSLLAAAGTRLSAAVAAASAGLGFDVFHTRPYGSFRITRAQDLEATFLLLAVGLVVGQLATRSRRHSHRAAETSYDLGRIHVVAEMLAEGLPASQVVIAVGNELKSLLDLRSCRFEPTFADPPGPFIERHGAVTWGSVRWGFETMGLPRKEVSLSVEHQGRPLGRFVLLTGSDAPVSTEQLLVAIALSDIAGAALAAQEARG